jgi:hypothetical protein
LGLEWPRNLQPIGCHKHDRNDREQDENANHNGPNWKSCGAFFFVVSEQSRQWGRLDGLKFADWVWGDWRGCGHGLFCGDRRGRAGIKPSLNHFDGVPLRGIRSKTFPDNFVKRLRKRSRHNRIALEVTARRRRILRQGFNQCHSHRPRVCRGGQHPVGHFRRIVGAWFLNWPGNSGSDKEIVCRKLQLAGGYENVRWLYVAVNKSIGMQI